MDALMLSYRRTGEVPPALLRRPAPPAPDVEYYLEAFNVLCRFRGSNGFGLNRLSYCDVERHATRLGITDPVEYDLFLGVISDLDAEYCGYFSDKRAAEKKSADKKRQSGVRRS